MRKENGSLTKVAVLRWYKKLEESRKAPEKKKGRVCCTGLERNERRVNEDLRCRYEGCERLCNSRAALVRHESRMHRRVEERVRFVSERCGLEEATIEGRRSSVIGGRTGRGAFVLKLHPYYFDCIIIFLKKFHIYYSFQCIFRKL